MLKFESSSVVVVVVIFPTYVAIYVISHNNNYSPKDLVFTHSKTEYSI